MLIPRVDFGTLSSINLHWTHWFNPTFHSKLYFHAIELKDELNHELNSDELHDEYITQRIDRWLWTVDWTAIWTMNWTADHTMAGIMNCMMDWKRCERRIERWYEWWIQRWIERQIKWGVQQWWNSSVNDELNDELNSELHDGLNDELNGELNSNVNYELHDEFQGGLNCEWTLTSMMNELCENRLRSRISAYSSDSLPSVSLKMTVFIVVYGGIGTSGGLGKIARCVVYAGWFCLARRSALHFCRFPPFADHWIQWWCPRCFWSLLAPEGSLASIWLLKLAVARDGGFLFPIEFSLNFSVCHDPQ